MQEASLLTWFTDECAVPTPYNFLARFLKAAGACRDKEVLLYASYLTELALPDYAMLKFSYSQTAAAAVYVANRCAPHSRLAALLPCPDRVAPSAVPFTNTN